MGHVHVTVFGHILELHCEIIATFTKTVFSNDIEIFFKLRDSNEA